MQKSFRLLAASPPGHSRLTMGSLAEEKNEGTIEFSLTRPIATDRTHSWKILQHTHILLDSNRLCFPIALGFGFFRPLIGVSSLHIGRPLAAVLSGHLGILISNLITKSDCRFCH